MKKLNIPSISALMDRIRLARSVQELMEKTNELTESTADAVHDMVDTVSIEQFNAAMAAKDAELRKAYSELYALKQVVGTLGVNVNYEYPNTTDGKTLNTLLNNDGTVKLTADVTTGRYGPGIFAKNHTTLDLNGHSITYTNAGNNGGIQARGTQELTVRGKGILDSGSGICVQCNSAGAVINLTGSSTVYQANRPKAELIYCYAGTINISGGTFINGGSPFLLNCYDANYRSGTARIVVTGGKFYDFDPGNNAAEGVGTSYLADGYISTPTTVVEDGVEHTVYTVKKG